MNCPHCGKKIHISDKKIEELLYLSKLDRKVAEDLARQRGYY